MIDISQTLYCSAKQEKLKRRDTINELKCLATIYENHCRIASISLPPPQSGTKLWLPTISTKSLRVPWGWRGNEWNEAEVIFRWRFSKHNHMYINTEAFGVCCIAKIGRLHAAWMFHVGGFDFARDTRGWGGVWEEEAGRWEFWETGNECIGKTDLILETHTIFHFTFLVTVRSYVRRKPWEVKLPPALSVTHCAWFYTLIHASHSN